MVLASFLQPFVDCSLNNSRVLSPPEPEHIAIGLSLSSIGSDGNIELNPRFAKRRHDRSSIVWADRDKVRVRIINRSLHLTFVCHAFLSPWYCVHKSTHSSHSDHIGTPRSFLRLAFAFSLLSFFQSLNGLKDSLAASRKGWQIPVTHSQSRNVIAGLLNQGCTP